MTPLASELARNGRPVWVPDLPGFGRSDKPRRVLSVHQLAGALRDWLDTVGIERALFVGNSMGCQIITELAHIEPQRIFACAFLGPTMDQFAPNCLYHVARLFLDQFHEPPSLIPLQAFEYLSNGPIRTIQTFLSALKHNMLERVKQIEQPCLILRGGCDPIAPQRWVQALAHEMSNAETRTIPGAGHALNYNSPGIVMQEMLRFFRERGVIT